MLKDRSLALSATALALLLASCGRDDAAAKKKPEAVTQLMKLSKDAKRVAAETGALPKDSAPPTMLPRRE